MNGIPPINCMSRTNFDLGLIPKPPTITKLVEDGFTTAVNHSMNNPGLCQPSISSSIITPVIEIHLDPMQRWDWWNDSRSSKIQLTLDHTIIVTLDRDKFMHHLSVIY